MWKYRNTRYLVYTVLLPFSFDSCTVNTQAEGLFLREGRRKRERERNSLTNEVLTSTLSSRHTNLRVGNFPRNRSSLSTSTIGDPSAPPPPTCSPPPFRDPPSLFTRCRPCVPVVLSTVFSGYCTVRLKYLFFCVCFLCIFLCERIINLLQDRRKAITNLDSILKSRDITLPAKVHIVKAMVFPVVMYGCESWTIKKAEHQTCFWTAVLEKTLKSPLDCKEIKWVHPKGNQPWTFIGRTDAGAQAPILWPPDAKRQLIGKDPVWSHSPLNIDEGHQRSLFFAGLYQYLLDNKYC